MILDQIERRRPGSRLQLTGGSHFSWRQHFIADMKRRQLLKRKRKINLQEPERENRIYSDLSLALSCSVFYFYKVYRHHPVGAATAAENKNARHTTSSGP
jgi:hypothetical protein